MLVGPGGVVALVIGAWGVLWALRRTPGRSARAWYGELVALVGAMFGAALSTSHAVALLGVLEWVRAEPPQRPVIAAETLGSVPRPIAAATIGLLVLGATVTAIRGRRSVEPSSEPVPLRALELVLAGLVVSSVAVGLGVSWLLLSEARSAMTALDAAAGAAPAMRVLGWTGAAAVVVDLCASALLGTISARRSG